MNGFSVHGIIICILLPLGNVACQTHYLAATFSSAGGEMNVDKAVRIQYEQIYPSGFTLGARGGVMWSDWHNEFYGMLGQIGREWQWRDKTNFSAGSLIGVEKNCTGAGLYARAGIGGRLAVLIEGTYVALWDKGIHPYTTLGTTLRLKIR